MWAIAVTDPNGDTVTFSLGRPPLFSVSAEGELSVGMPPIAYASPKMDEAAQIVDLYNNGD